MFQPVSLRIRLVTLYILGFSLVLFYGYLLFKPAPSDLIHPEPAAVLSLKKGKQHKDEAFALAMQIIQKHEGRSLNTHAHDRGGQTKYGISQKAYPHLKIERLTWKDAQQIYHKDYWQRYNFARIRFPQIAVKVMDMTVNMGPNRTFQIIKSALARQNIDLHTKHMNLEAIRAINQAEPISLLDDLRNESCSFYKRLASRDSSQSKFLKGWLRRARA